MLSLWRGWGAGEGGDFHPRFPEKREAGSLVAAESTPYHHGLMQEPCEGSPGSGTGTPGRGAGGLFMPVPAVAPSLGVSNALRVLRHTLSQLFVILASDITRFYKNINNKVNWVPSRAVFSTPLGTEVRQGSPRRPAPGVGIRAVWEKSPAGSSTSGRSRVFTAAT